MKDGVDKPGRAPRTFQKSNEELLTDERLNRRALSLVDGVVAILDIPHKHLSLVRLTEGDLEVESSLENIPEALIEKGWVHVDDTKTCRAFFSQIYAGAQKCKTDMRVLSANKDWVSYEVHAATVFSETGQPKYAVLSALDATLKKRDNAKAMVDKAHERDLLSGLLNGEVFRQRVADALKNDRRTKEGYLFIIDIDNLEEINDKCGKSSSDEVIRSLADVLKKCFRSEDILGRVGAAEFMAFVSNIDAKRAKARGSEIAENLGQIQYDKLNDLAVALSIGIAEAGVYDGYVSLHKKAYKALYRAKSNGRGSWSLWE